MAEGIRRVWLDTKYDDQSEITTGVDLPVETPGSTPPPDMRWLLVAVGGFGLAYFLALSRLVRGDLINSYPYVSADGFDWLVEGFAVARWFDGIAIPQLPSARGPGFVTLVFADFHLGADGLLILAAIALALAGSLAAMVVLARWVRVPPYQAGVVILVFALAPLGYYRMWILSDQVAGALLVVSAIALHPYITQGSRWWLGLAVVAAGLGGTTQLYGLAGFLVAGGWCLAVSLWRRRPDYLLAGGLVIAPLLTTLLSKWWLANVPHGGVPPQLSLIKFSFDMFGFYLNTWSFAFLPLFPLLGVLLVHRRREVMGSPLVAGYWLSVLALMVATFFYQFEESRFTIPTGLMLGVAIMATLPGERPLPRPRELMVVTAGLAVLLGLFLAPASYWVPRWSEVSLDPSGTYLLRLLSAEPVDRLSVGSACDSSRVCAGVVIPAGAAQHERVRFGLYRYLTTADSLTRIEDFHEGIAEGVFEFRNSNDCCLAEMASALGMPGDRPIVGNWDGQPAAPGSGTDTPGVFRGGRWTLVSSPAAATADRDFEFGQARDRPVVGDWDGDGVDTIGVFRDGLWMLRNSNSPGPADREFRFGEAGDLPVVGDWDGDGVDTVGVFRNGRWKLTNTNGAGPSNVRLEFGEELDWPVAGDWDGDGVDTMGVFRDGTWMLRNSSTAGPADLEFFFGAWGHRPISGDWDGDGTDSIGIAR